MALGIGLIPLRSYTSASNLAFVFLILTIVVAELGGRGAALVTALVSAMSLNFFLTEPYLTLAISKRDDLIVFVALAACGLIAAAFGKRRARWSEVADRAGAGLDTLHALVGHLRGGAPLDDLLRDLKRGFGLGALVLRDADDRILAVAPPGSAPAVIPETQLAADTLLPSDESKVRFGARGPRLPEGGGRIRVRSDRGFLWLDLWEGDAEGFGVDESRTLAVAAAILELALSRRPTG
jgi:two-component system sensor histidine kinase KdpD